ncbi:tetratricopeptide repeat protein [Capilliphycus salinus ALCB114379]|uniref:tetratricopeptide repeat protein n=1 Tax=Capilliphycus salinus TaxID=2768948 RepID=UPI0039A48209
MAVAWIDQGISLSEFNQYERAKIALETGLKIEPNHSSALVNLCAAFNKIGNYQDALTACEGALQTDGNLYESDPADAYLQKGQALAGLSRYEEAITSIDTALNLKPESAIAWNTKSVILWQAQNYREALQANDRALALDQNYFQGWFNRGGILRAIQQNQEALAAYERAVNSDISLVYAATLASVWANRSAILWNLGKYQMNEKIRIKLKSYNHTVVNNDD